MEYIINETALGFPLSLKTTGKCFSPKHIDAGTRALLSRAAVSPGQKILDLGCGYGVIGIACALIAGQENVVMLDIDPAAVELAKENARRNRVPLVRVYKSDGFSRLDETGFDLILCNPPYHADFSVARRFIEKGFNRLKTGGRMLLVTKRREWYRQKLLHIFGGVGIYPEGGYFVFEAVKTSPHYAKNRK